DKLVTGVQTCALPISRIRLGSKGNKEALQKNGLHPGRKRIRRRLQLVFSWRLRTHQVADKIVPSSSHHIGFIAEAMPAIRQQERSEERRVGKDEWSGE